jgi:hypothetical protein
MNVPASTSPLTAVQNHYEPGPTKAMPSVLMNFTSDHSLLLATLDGSSRHQLAGTRMGTRVVPRERPPNAHDLATTANVLVDLE